MRKLNPIAWQYIDIFIIKKQYPQNSSKHFDKRKKAQFFFSCFHLKSSNVTGKSSIAAYIVSEECSLVHLFPLYSYNFDSAVNHIPSLPSPHSLPLCKPCFSNLSQLFQLHYLLITNNNAKNIFEFVQNNLKAISFLSHG